MKIKYENTGSLCYPWLCQIILFFKKSYLSDYQLEAVACQPGRPGPTELQKLSVRLLWISL